MRARRWWKRAGAAQARALLFLVYYTILAPFALLARTRKGSSTPGGWVPRTGPSGDPLDKLRRQH